jgi:hypothetical protein
MTIKEAIHAKVEQLDEDQAQNLLTHIERMLDEEEDIGPVVERTEAQRQAMLSLIGMVRSPEPTNIAKYKDDYIADAILHRDEPDS